MSTAANRIDERRVTLKTIEILIASAKADLQKAVAAPGFDSFTMLAIARAQATLELLRPFDGCAADGILDRLRVAVTDLNDRILSNYWRPSSTCMFHNAIECTKAEVASETCRKLRELAGFIERADGTAETAQ